MAIAMLILLIVTIAFLVWYRVNMPKIRGKIGEFNASLWLATLPKKKYHILNNVIIHSKYGTTQIDHVVVSIYGIFVIETKNYKGLIYGGENAEKWTKNMWGKKYEFRNPIKQNYGHTKALQEVLHIPIKHFIPIVVFSNNAKISVQTDKTVINLIHLRSEIRRYRTSVFTNEQVADFVSTINKAIVEEKSTTKQHVHNVKSSIHKKNQAIANGICPRCGGHLVSRNGRFGSFYGCSNYPNCKFTLNR